MTPIGRAAPVGAVSSRGRPEWAQVKTLPSLTIVRWIAGVSWALAIFAYLRDGTVEWIFPLFMLGALDGIAEWFLWQRLN